MLEPAEMPQDMKYIVEVGPHPASDSASILFRIDISGSMCHTACEEQPSSQTHKVDEEMLRLQREFGEGFVCP